MTLSAVMFLIFLFCTSASGFFTQTSRYDELQRLANPCYPRDTCQSLPSITGDNMWSNRTCECGEHCIPHKTCCIDSGYFGVDQFIRNRTDVCQKVQTRDFKVYMVSTCLQGWYNSYIYKKCMNPEINLQDPLSEVPVTTIASMTTYRNFFCATCNNDADSAIFWDIGLNMPKNLFLHNDVIMTIDDVIERMEYNSEQKAWGFFYLDLQTKKQRFVKIEIKFTQPQDLKKLIKPCHPGIISKCNPSYKSTRLRYKCEAYYSPIKGRKQGSGVFLNYRNIHCALCNGLRANKDEIVCLLKDNLRRGASLSFAKLLDVNRKTGDIVGKTSLCKDRQIYDRFHKKCRSLGCALTNYVMKNGACVKSD